jgi:hypothetical protein
LSYIEILNNKSIKAIAAMLNSFTKEREEGGAGLRFDLIDGLQRSTNLDAFSENLFKAVREAKSAIKSGVKIYFPSEDNFREVLELASKNLRLVKNVITTYALTYFVKVEGSET